MVSLVEKYRPNQPPAEIERLGDFLRDELERLATAMAGRDEVVTGRTSFASASTAAVLFSRAQPDLNYQVFFGAKADLRLWASAIATTGFTINANTSNSNTASWAVFRDRDND